MFYLLFLVLAMYFYTKHVMLHRAADVSDSIYFTS